MPEVTNALLRQVCAPPLTPKRAFEACAALGALAKWWLPREVLDQAGLTTTDVKLFIPHQANQRITDAVASKLDVDESRVYSNIAMHGNTSSASIPIGLDECVEAGRVQKGDVILMASFGGGVTWGGLVMRW